MDYPDSWLEFAGMIDYVLRIECVVALQAVT